MWYNKRRRLLYFYFKCPRRYANRRFAPCVSDNYTITCGYGIMKKITGWLPDEDRWWITGFIPDVYDQWLSSKFGLDWGDTVTEDELLQIASVDFSENPQMLIDLKKNFEGKREAQYLIFDMEENTLWIAW